MGGKNRARVGRSKNGESSIDYLQYLYGKIELPDGPRSDQGVSVGGGLLQELVSPVDVSWKKRGGQVGNSAEERTTFPPRVDDERIKTENQYIVGEMGMFGLLLRLGRGSEKIPRGTRGGGTNGRCGS